MKICRILVLVAMLIGLMAPASVSAGITAAPDATVAITVLHTNDFHGNLEKSGSNPGAAKLATIIRANYTTGSTLLVDAGDEMQGSLLSNLNDGAPVIDFFNQAVLTGAEVGGPVGYDAATFGNHEFDWEQSILQARVDQATYPYISANIVASDDCSAPGWDKPAFVDEPYVIKTLQGVDIALIGVTTLETPTITIAGNTAGLCFVDPVTAISHYYADMLADGADAILVISHLGYTDGGYGYGLPVDGDQTLAAKLRTAGKPVTAIIGGHSHTNLAGVAKDVNGTLVVQSHYAGRRVGKLTLTFDTVAQTVVPTWTDVPVVPGGDTPTPDTAAITTLINEAKTPEYLALVNDPVGYAQTDLVRNYNGDSMMADFVDDAIYNQLNTDAEPANDVDMFFNNPGGIRTDWCLNAAETAWVSDAAECATGLWTRDPLVLTYGNMFTILPFGNATVTGTMTGAQIVELLNQAAVLSAGAIQVSGLKYKFYHYNNGTATWAWGAYDVTFYDKAADAWVPLDLSQTYAVGTNEFLAPAGQDGFIAFKYFKNAEYWGDMLDAVNAYVETNYGTPETAYKGPNGDGALDGRITRDGNDAGGTIVPVTLLHHNDSHGNLLFDPVKKYASLTQLATLIAQERSFNPDRTLLFNLGDQVQGDAMMYYFKNAGGGFASDGTDLPSNLSINPMIAAMNEIDYDAMVLGNHEFNFGKEVFYNIFKDATFPILGANLSDDGSYGVVMTSVEEEALAKKIPVQDTLSFVLPGSAANPAAIRVGVFGITNHRVPNYELPSNIVGLTFSDPIEKAKELVPGLGELNDAVVGLTHIGFTTNPTSLELDENVDTFLAATVDGIDAILGGHSHTDPSKGYGDYKYLPTIVPNPSGEAVMINQAYRYNTYLGKVVLGFRPTAEGGWELVSRAGNYKAVVTKDPITAEDAAVKAIVDPYNALLAAYNATILGDTLHPIDALTADIEETSGGNLQADAAVAKLESEDIEVDVHLSGAMTNKMVAGAATPASPVTLTISDMFTLMPYENSLVVLSMNGPQIKTVLERGYRNYYYYKYFAPDYGGYSHYTTCLLDTNSVGKITYVDTYPVLPSGNNVVSFTIGGVPVDFTDAAKFYNVSTVNYLAAGSCNFNDGGVSLWPLDQIVQDTQFYVRDSVIEYIQAQTDPIDYVVGDPGLRLIYNILDSMSFMPFMFK